MEQPPGQQLTFGGVIFVDDAAYPVQATTPGELCQAATEVARIVASTWASHGIRTDFKPSKTEALLC
eukprot:9835605-Lingulodinium_polyedra.AAC.1